MNPICICFLAFIGLIEVQPFQHTLDLTTAPQESAPLKVAGGSGCAHGSSGQVPTRLPLHVRLLQTDRSEYTVGDQAVFDVSVQNGGSTPIRLPWRLHRGGDQMTGVEAAPVMQMRLTLLAIDQEGREHRLVGTMLAGAEDDAGSTRVLQPGESALIRFGGRMRSISDAAEFLESISRGTMNLRARILVSTGHCEWSAPAFSSNVINVSLHPISGRLH